MTTKNIEMVSGDAVVLEITILDETTDTAVNLAGCTGNFAIGRVNSRRILVSKSSSSGITFPDPTNGRVDVELDATDTEDLEGVYDYELQITDSAGNRSTPLLGRMTIGRDLIET